MKYELKHVGAHVEVYDPAGRFCFSADTLGDALRELEELERNLPQAG